jgi:hypothetical protein
MKKNYLWGLLGLVMGVTIGAMNEHIFRKILSFFVTSKDPHYDEFGISSFAVGENEELEKVVTIHSDANGNLIFSAFEPEEWEMMNGICEITGRDINDLIEDIEADDTSRILVVDPREFPDDDEDPFGMF